MVLGRSTNRAAMLEGLMNVEGGGQAIPFVRSFCGSSSSYLWEDRFFWHHHTIPQGEGGEQGDPLMPLLFSLGQHGALQAIDSDLNDNEVLFAFLDVSQQTSVGFLQNPYQRRKDPGVERDWWQAGIARAQDPDVRGGDQSCQWFNRGSKSSAPLWDILLSWRHISARRLKNKHLMYNLRGLSCFIVQRPERTLCWGWWNRKPPHRILSATMRVCGSVCVRILHVDPESSAELSDVATAFVQELEGAPEGALGRHWPGSVGSNHQRGRLWSREHAPHQWNLRHWSQEVTEVGNMWFRPRWSTSTER